MQQDQRNARAILTFAGFSLVFGASCAAEQMGPTRAAPSALYRPSAPTAQPSAGADPPHSEASAGNAVGAFVVEHVAHVLRTYEAARSHAVTESEAATLIRAAPVAAVVGVMGIYGVCTNMGGSIILFHVVDLVRGQGVHAALIGGHGNFAPHAMPNPDVLYAAALRPLPGVTPCAAAKPPPADTCFPFGAVCVDAAIDAAVPVATRVEGATWLTRVLARSAH